MDDPLAGVTGPSSVRAPASEAMPWCPVCGVATRGGRCPACDPARPITAEGRKAKARAIELEAVRARRLAAIGRAPRNPLLWLALAFGLVATWWWAVVYAVVGSYLALWWWVGMTAKRYPVGHRRRAMAGGVATLLVVLTVALLLGLAFVVGQARLAPYRYGAR